MSASQEPQQQPATEEHAPRRSKRDRARTAAIVVLAVLITVFAVVNFGEVKVDWVLGSGKAPLIVVIVISLVVGILITYVAERRAGRRR
jgi:uncharacterized integral membrane protein